MICKLILKFEFDVPLVRWSGLLERGRPRPLNPPLMQTQPVLVFGLKATRSFRNLELVRAPNAFVNPADLLYADRSASR